MQVPDEVRKCVTFLLYKNKKEQTILAGTGFFISYKIDEKMSFGFLVTAKHVIVGIRQRSIDGIVILRMNDRQGGTRMVKIHVDEWIEHPTDSSVDIMVVPVQPQLDIYDFLYLPSPMIATDEVIKKHSIGLGEDLFITGLFANHYGKKRNVPIVRVGNIASMPEEKVDTRDFGSIEAYLIEARSIGGLSGSPVFVNLDPLRAGNLMFTNKGVKGSVLYLLGIVHGHWDMIESESDGLIQDIDGGRVNMGIAIVIPAAKILEVLEQPKLAEERERVMKEAKKNNPGYGSV